MMKSVHFLTRNTKQMSLPVHRRELGVYVFLLSLAMFFLFTLASVIIVRGVSIPSLEKLQIRLPASCIFSTMFLLGGSYSLFRSLYHVQRQKLMVYKYWLFYSLVCSLFFTGFQGIGVAELLNKYNPVEVSNKYKKSHFPVQFHGIQNETVDQELLVASREQTQYNIVAGLVALHVLHFAGGIIFLSYVCVQAYRDRYDHEYYSGIKMAAFYWRFLDVVWLLMLGTFIFSA